MKSPLTVAARSGDLPVQLAVQDLALRLGIDSNQVRVLEVREVIWPDTSLGCPEPGKVYAQMRVAGQLIRLKAKGRMYFYHSGRPPKPVFCEQTTQLFRKTLPESDEFVPPPDSDID